MSSRTRALFLSLAVAILVMGPVAAAAQPTLVAGVKAGVNSSTIAVGGVDTDMDFSQLLGGVGGAFVGAELTENFDLVLEGLYSQRGTKGTTLGGARGDLRFNYIDMPLLARIGTSTANGVRIHIFTGPQAGFRLSAKAINEDDEELDIKDETEDIDFGWTLGAGMEVKGFLLDARYTMGVRNMIIDEEGATSRNRTFTVMAGYRFK